MTDNRFFAQGATTISELFQVNTTLTSLDLNGEEEGKEKEK